jgi:hypothetical protein
MASTGSQKVEMSVDSTHEGFDLFATPPTLTAVMAGEDEEHLPISGESLQSELEFRVLAGDKAYTDLSESRLELEVKIVKADGSNLSNTAANHTVWLGDNFAHSLFDRVTFRIGERDIEYAPNYAMRSYIDNALNFSKEDKKSGLYVSSGWLEDSATAVDGDAQGAAAIATRKALCTGSKTLSFMMRPRLSFMSQARLLYPRLAFSLKLSRNPASFCLTSDSANPNDGAKVVITKAVFHVRRMIANDSLYLAHAQRLLDGATVKYPIDRTRVSYYTVDQGAVQSSFKLDQSVQRPNRVVIGFVDAEALNGHFVKNPYAFKPYGLTSIELELSALGERIKFEPSFTTGSGLARPYAKLASLVDRLDTGSPFGITLTEWQNKYNLYGFDFTGDLSHGDAFHLVSDTTLTLKLKFSTALANSITVVVYQELDDIVKFDVKKQVSMLSSAL